MVNIVLIFSTEELYYIIYKYNYAFWDLFKHIIYNAFVMQCRCKVSNLLTFYSIEY